MSEVDVIILDIDGGEMLQACIDAVYRQSKPAAQVIIFDNGSKLPVLHRVRHRGTPSPRIIRSETNLGFAAANNEALKQSTAPLVALLNNDVVVDEDWLATLTSQFDLDPKLGAIQSVIRRDAKTLDGAGIDISNGTFRQLGHFAPIGEALPQAWGVSATATLYRRRAIGNQFFDPRFFAYYEDVELCARLHRDGWKTRVLPTPLATHRGSQSAPVLGREAVRLRTRNRYFVARMHPGVGSIPALMFEDLFLMAKRQSSLGAIFEGLTTRL